MILETDQLIISFLKHEELHLDIFTLQIIIIFYLHPRNFKC